MEQTLKTREIAVRMVPQQVPQDSVQAVVDTLAAQGGLQPTVADSQAIADSQDLVGGFGREVSEAGQLLLTGQWDVVLDRFYQGLAGQAASFVPRFFSALFVLLIFYIAYRVFRSVLDQILTRSSRVDQGLQSLLLKTFSVVALSFIAVMVLGQIGINVTGLLAGLSIAGIAVGFAARDTLENFISGITILIDRPFRVGDYLEIEEIYGRVVEITLRSTRICTLNNEILVMPNTHMINQKLINHAMLGVLRVEVPFGIAYKEYPQEARDVVMALTKDDERLHPDYPSSVVVTALNDSSVDMCLRLFLKDPGKEVSVRLEYVERVREALRRADIEIPFPHLQLFIDEAKAFNGARIGISNDLDANATGSSA